MSLLTDLVAYWKLDEASGTRHDSHGSYDFAETGMIGSGSGRINSAADFPNSFITRLDNSDLLDDLNSLGGGAYSLSMWIYPRLISGYRCVYDKAPNLGVAFFIDSATSGFDDNALHFSEAWTLNEWQHLTVTQTAAGGTKTYYRNGVQTAVSTGVRAAPSGTFTLGANPSGGGAPWDGLIDEFGAWSRVLDGPEILALYNAGAGLAYPFTTGIFFRRRRGRRIGSRGVV